jgi:leader peptidase (prepilin peptidase)/N-methyltransferase
MITSTVTSLLNPWWAAPLWAALGALIGTALHRPARTLLPAPRQAHPLIAALTLASITACLFGLLAWRVNVRPELLAYSALAAVGVPLAAIDILDQRLPSKLLIPAYPIVAALLVLAAIAEHNGTAILRSLAGMIVLSIFYLIIALAAPGALGAADIRLAGLLGLTLGWPGWTTVISGTMLGLLYGSLTGATMIVLRRATRHTLIPFGPALIAGAFTALLVAIGVPRSR